MRSVVAAVETRQEFGLRVAAEVCRLKLPGGVGLNILGDGADWIWNLAGEHFPQTRRVLDFWHAAVGAIKRLVNLRVKRTAARWDVKRVGDFV